MDEYDDFGNYIGGEGVEYEGGGGGGVEGGPQDSGEREEGEGDLDGFEDGDGEREEHHQQGQGGGDLAIPPPGAALGGGEGGAYYASAIVLHEDKRYYPDAEEVYAGAETMVQEEDTQPITQPLVAPVEVQTFSSLDDTPPTTRYTPQFLASLLTTPARVRTLAIVGHLHHGKTSLADLLIEATLVHPWDPSTSKRYTDARVDEQARGISLKTTPFTLALPDLQGRSTLLQCLDTPGHVNFSDEVCTGLRLADGVVIAVDVLEGALMGTERAVRAALGEGLPCILALTKVDRLILDLKLPPGDAYFKILQVIGEVNTLLARYTPHGGTTQVLTPLDGSVVFVGAHHGWSFSLASFAAAAYGGGGGVGGGKRGRSSGSAGGAGGGGGGGGGVDPLALSTRLWGDVWYNGESGKFQRTPPSSATPRSFITFVLEPLYKVYSVCLGESGQAVRELATSLGLSDRQVPRAALAGNARALLKCVLGAWLGGCGGLVSALLTHTPSPLGAGPATARRLYQGDAVSPEVEGMGTCDPQGVLMVNCVKLVPDALGKSFLALGKVLSGTLRVGQKVKVLGESYSAEESEDMQLATVRGVHVGQGRYTLKLEAAPPGSLVLIEGLGDAMVKGATVTSAGEESMDVGIFAPVAFNTSACVNVSVEPLNPSELPKVLGGLRAILKTYPLARTRVEESGEHVLIGTGELAMDCMLRDLREMYAKVEVKVADPVVSFSETCAEQSSLQCFALTPNKKNKFTMLAEPLDKGLAEKIEGGEVSLAWERKRVETFFTQGYGWDTLAARSVWAFGPSAARGGNVLLNDTLPGEVDKGRLGAVKDSFIQGFQWGCREGPLCDEPLRGVRFRLLAADISGEPVARGGGQVIPTARRLLYSSFLTAAPRLLEPVFKVEVLCPGELSTVVAETLAGRRGHVQSEAPRPGTPFVLIQGFLPVMDSFGFETDLRVATQGLAFPQQVFDHWSLVPGDPLDKSAVLRPLEASPPHALARDFMVKTRRRKGLPEDVVPTRFFDSELLLELLQSEEGGK